MAVVPRRLVGALLTGLALLGAACGDDDAVGHDAGPGDAGGPGDTSWRVVATAGLMVGGYGDNFVYDGSDLRPGPGGAEIEVDPVADTGRLEVTWTGTHRPTDATTHTGEIRIVIDTWVAMNAWELGGVAEDISIHGDTGAGPPVMPTVHAFLAGWGPARVYVDDALEHEVHGHFMVTDGAREPDGVIYRSDRMTPYDPTDPGDSWVDPDDRELHVVAHTSDPDRFNYPMHTLWFHLNFEDLVIERAPAGAVY